MNALILTRFTGSTMNVSILMIGSRRYSKKLWKAFSNLFNYLPVAALIDDKVLCMHGGLSPNLDEVKQILQVRRPLEIPE